MDRGELRGGGLTGAGGEERGGRDCGRRGGGGTEVARSRGEAGGAPGWRGGEGREAGGVRELREAGRADAAGEGAGQEGEGEREREKCRGCSGGGGGSSGSGDGGGGSAPTRSSLRAPPSSRERASASGQASGRTTPATRALWWHRAHPGAAQAPRAELQDGRQAQQEEEGLQCE